MKEKTATQKITRVKYEKQNLAAITMTLGSVQQPMISSSPSAKRFASLEQRAPRQRAHPRPLGCGPFHRASGRIAWSALFAATRSAGDSPRRGVCDLRPARGAARGERNPAAAAGFGFESRGCRHRSAAVEPTCRQWRAEPEAIRCRVENMPRSRSQRQAASVLPWRAA